MIMEVQESVCGALETLDGAGKFKEDAWTRPGGGGGISRVLQDGAVFEKAGVNISVVYGVMPPEAYRAAKAAATDQKPGPIPFFAAGISSVINHFKKNGSILLKEENADNTIIFVFFFFFGRFCIPRIRLLLHCILIIGISKLMLLKVFNLSLIIVIIIVVVVKLLNRAC